MKIALPWNIRPQSVGTVFVNNKPQRSYRRINIGRMLWIIGLVAGLAIGAAAAIGLAGAASNETSVTE
jgi:hypothetical protein